MSKLTAAQRNALKELQHKQDNWLNAPIDVFGDWVFMGNVTARNRRELVKQGFIIQMGRYSEFYQITDAGRAALTQED